MNKKTTAATLVVVFIIVAAVTTWFFLNQPDTPNQTNAVKITAFSVDPEGWKDLPEKWAVCAFNITIENTGTNDVEGLWLKVTMFGFGEIVRHSKSGSILSASGNLRGFTLSAGEARTFQGELRSGATIEYFIRSPVGATYLAQVVVGSRTVLDEAEWTDPLATIFFVAVIATGVTMISIAIYFKKRKR